MRRRAFLKLLFITTAGVACAPAAAPTAPPPPATTAPQPAVTAAPKPAATPPPKPAAAAPATPKALTRVRLAEIPAIADNGFAILGVEKGFYRDEGIDLVEVPLNQGAAMVQAMVANEIDVAEVGPSPVFPADETGASLKVVGAVRPKVTQVLMSRRDVQGPPDLVGKTVATGAPGAILHVEVLAYLQQKGVDPNKVSFVALGTTQDNFNALVAGKVEAGLVNAEQIPLIKDNPDLKVLDELYKELPLFLRVGLVAPDRFLQQSDVVLGLMTAMAKSVRYAIEHKDDFVKYGVTTLKLPEEQVMTSYDYDVKNRTISPDLDFNRDSIDFMQKLNIQVGNQKSVLPFDRVATLDFQQKVIAKLGKYQWKT